MNMSDWISLFEAIGTFGAAVIALWLALRDSQRRIDATFIWEPATKYEPTLLVQNTSNRISVIKNIEIQYYHQHVCTIETSEDFELANYAIIESGQIQRIPMSSFLREFPRPTNEKKKYKLKTIIRQHSGKSCVFVLKLSYEDLQERFFGQGLFATIRHSL